MMGQILMLVTIVSFLMLGIGIMAVTNAPFVEGVPFGIGGWAMENTAGILAGGIWLFLMSVSLMQGSISWKHVIIFTAIGFGAFLMFGGIGGVAL